MPGKKGGYDKKEFKKVYKKLAQEESQLRAHLKSLKKHVEQMEKGDGKKAYWSGKRAYNWYCNMLGHYDHDVRLLTHLHNCNQEIKRSLYGADAL